MARKLKVQLEVDSSKARSTVARDMSGIDIGGTPRATGPHSSGAAADRLAKSLDNAAKKSGALASSHEVLSAKTRQVVGAFAGMGVSMAMSFASQNMKRGSARSAVEVGAGTLQGAAMGGMAGGPWGALAGGVIGLGMGLWNKSQERKRYTEDWGKSEHDYASDKAFQNLVKSLTDVSDKTVDFGAKIKAVEEELEKYKQVEGKLKANVESFIKSGRYDDADAQRGYLAENRQRQEQLEAAKKQLEGAAKKEDEKTIEAIGPGGTDALEAIGPGGGTDALQKVGGMRGVFPAEKMDNLESGFRSAVQSANRNLEKLEEDGNKVLREIAANTRKQGVSKWQ